MPFLVHLYFRPKILPGLEIDTAISCLSATSSSSLDIIYSAIDEDYRRLLSDVKIASKFSKYSVNLKSDFDCLSISDNLVLFDSRRIVLPHICYSSYFKSSSHQSFRSQ